MVLKVVALLVFVFHDLATVCEALFTLAFSLRKYKMLFHFHLPHSIVIWSLELILCFQFWISVDFFYFQQNLNFIVRGEAFYKK